ncbi:MAG: response regulator [Candidatus Glassbacteria bacterium]|nr:response regulator [Candidatus Glassbacteria bacterium]
MTTLKILVADDEPGMRLAVERALRSFRLDLPEIGEEVHFETSPAESGEQALEMIGNSPPDILLLDHKMQGISGLEVLERLRGTESQDILTVMVTAYASLETAVSAIKKGAFDFLAKPFTPQELKDTVSKAAENLIMARHARRLEQEKRQVRFQFISVLAHELKAPLNAIEGYLNIMREQPEAMQSRETYERVIERCTVRTAQMRKLIVDLLETTRIESGRKKRELAQVDLAAAARAAIETAAPEAQQRGIEIRLEAPGQITMTADRSEIEIILNNLVSNAVKYNRDGGRVVVKIEQRDSRVVIAVSDTGIGMTAEEAASLFQEFVRIKNDKTRNILGSGLGLSIVKKLALLYGGKVEVASTPDEGSTFTATLDRADCGEN